MTSTISIGGNTDSTASYCPASKAAFAASAAVSATVSAAVCIVTTVVVSCISAVGITAAFTVVAAVVVTAVVAPLNIAKGQGIARHGVEKYNQNQRNRCQNSAKFLHKSLIFRKFSQYHYITPKSHNQYRFIKLPSPFYELQPKTKPPSQIKKPHPRRSAVYMLMTRY
jgi:hypothetical protein